MSKVWKWIALLCVILLILGAALIAVAHFTGGSMSRLLSTTDIADMTKFVSREQLETYVGFILGQR